MNPATSDSKSGKRAPKMRASAPDTFGSWVYACLVLLLFLQLLALIAPELI